MASKALIIDGVDVKTLVFNFYNILGNADTRAVFMKHLKCEYNTEPLEFLMDVEKLENIPFPAQEEAAVKMALDIVNTYIFSSTRKEVPKHINLGSQTLEHVKRVFSSNNQFDNVKTWVSTVERAPCKAFLNVKEGIQLELQSESFPRFVRSKLWHEFLRTKDSKFLSSISTKRVALNFNYIDDSFSDHIVTDSDLAFAQRLTEDDFNWELQGSHQVRNSNVQGYSSVGNYLPNVSWAGSTLNVAKFVATLPYNVHFIAKTRFPGTNISKIDPNAKFTEEMHYYDNAKLKQMYPNQISSNCRESAVICFHCRLPFPLTTPRWYLNTSTIDYQPDKEQYIMVHKPCRVEKKMPKKFLPFNNFQMIFLKKLTEERTLLTEIHLVKLFGWGDSKALFNATVFGRAKDMQKNLLAALKMAKEGKFENKKEDDFLYRLLKATQAETRTKQYLEDQERKDFDNQQAEARLLAQTDSLQNEQVAPEPDSKDLLV